MSVVIAYNPGITNSVINVATASPKMIVYAIGIHIGDLPPNPIAIGISPKIVVTVGENNWTQSEATAFQNSVPLVIPLFSVLVNEVDKNNGIVHHNPCERDDAKHRYNAQCRIGDEKTDHRTDDPEWNSKQNDDRLYKRLELRTPISHR